MLVVEDGQSGGGDVGDSCWAEGDALDGSDLTHDILVGFDDSTRVFVGIEVLGVWWWGIKSPYGVLV